MKQIQDFNVLKNRRLNADHYILELQSKHPIEDVCPGQFVQIEIPDSKTTFLRRPLSVHFYDKSKNMLSLYVRIVGEGTKYLGMVNENDTLNLVYPLGNKFTLVNKKKVLLVGGGSGIAPLLLLASELQKSGNEVVILLGARTADGLLEINTFEKYGKVVTTTNDGSAGVKGLVIDHPVMKDQNKFDFVYTCGPDVMMKAVGEWAKNLNIQCEVSLENTMACGIGACLCCIQKTVRGNLCVCTDGPVFNFNDVVW
ncbi:MAG TPA: dihydroorotate dehydrogenase electron transfer subunit [Bacteroidales bacterium]|nr:dihydroorotate dehydrogenase electron transfer subunit [Bacteroidales bacterium]